MEPTMPAVESGQAEVPTESAPVEQTPVEATEPVSEDAGFEVTQAPNTEVAEAEGRAVPYDRFSEVIAERNYYKELAQKVQAPVAQEQPTEQQIPMEVYTQDETGEWVIDPNKFMAWTNQQAAINAQQVAEATYQRRENERQAWEEVEKTHPEMVKDPDLRTAIEGIAFTEFSKGNKISLKQAADRLKQKLSAERTAGQKAAQVSETIQENAKIEVGQTPVPTVDEYSSARQKGFEEGEWDDFFKELVKKSK